MTSDNDMPVKLILQCFLWTFFLFAKKRINNTLQKSHSLDIHKCLNHDAVDTLFVVSNPRSVDDVWHENVDLMCMCNVQR